MAAATPITLAESEALKGKVKSAAPVVEAEQTPGKSKAADDSRVDPGKHTPKPSEHATSNIQTSDSTESGELTRTSYWVWRKPRDEVQTDSTPTTQTDSQEDKGDKGKPLHHPMLPEAEAMSASEELSASPAGPALTSVEELPLASVSECFTAKNASPSVSLSEPSTPTKPEGLAPDHSATSEQVMSPAIASESPLASLPVVFGGYPQRF
jgi:hypothetical protein